MMWKGLMSKIKMFVMDVDGVLTDGCTYYSARGEEMKKFNMKDGMGISLLKQRGIIPVIITQENSKIVLKRAKKLGVEVYIGVKDKLKKVTEIADKYRISLDAVGYIGDDINDIEAMKVVALPFAPADAVEEVKKIARVVTQRKGGRGCVREAIDYILCLGDRGK